MGLNLVDSSVWIDWLGDRDTLQTHALNLILDRGDPLAIADLVLAEVLQGSRTDGHFLQAYRLLSEFVPVVVPITALPSLPRRIIESCARWGLRPARPSTH